MIGPIINRQAATHDQPVPLTVVVRILTGEGNFKIIHLLYAVRVEQILWHLFIVYYHGLQGTVISRR